MNEQHVFPVSPNTLLMTLHTISLVHKWYEVASRFEKSRAELAKAQKSFDFFQNQFENVGKNLNKAQEAFETAQRHLKSYRGKVSALSGQESPATGSPTSSLSFAAPFPFAGAIAAVIAPSGMNPASFDVAGFSFSTTSR